jgi:hypothetical protein
MIVLVLLIVGLAIELWQLLSGLWPLLLAVLGLYSFCRWLVAAHLHARREAARDRLRHERARREIDRIATETRREMYDAALRHGELIEGTAIEVKDR